MQTEYRRTLKDHYLVIRGGRHMESDAYQIRMLRENQLNWFTDCHTELIDDEVRFFYRITSMRSLEELIGTKPVGGNLLRALFRSLAEALREAEGYLLPQDGIVLCAEWIYTGADQQQFRFCYWPGQESGLPENLKTLSEYLLPHLDEQDPDAVMLGFSFYQLCAAGELTEERLLNLLYEEPDRGLRRGVVPQQAQPAENQKGDPETAAREAERAMLLDDFFSDEDEIEALRAEDRRKGIFWYAVFSLLALGTAAVLACLGMVQTGIGTAVLIMAGAFVLRRYRTTIREIGSRLRDRTGRRRSKEEKLLEQVDLNWRTYEERAADDAMESFRLEVSDGREQDRTFQHGGMNSFLPDKANRSDDSGMEETVWLEPETMQNASVRTCWLIPQEISGMRQIALTEREHLLGKSDAACDIVVSAAAVSRLHARLIREDTGYAVVDLRSKNGTWLNGMLLESGRAYPLTKGDRLRFADWECVYEETGIQENKAEGLFRRASMTVEAAFALPFFFLCMVSLICTLDIYAQFANKTVKLQQTAEKAALTSVGAGAFLSGQQGSGAEDGIVDLPEILTYQPPGFAFPLTAIRVRCRGRVRAWIGYTPSDADAGEDAGNQLVYVTDYESVYHTSSDCTHLDLTWEAVASSDAAHLHNQYGNHYHACEKCIGSGAVNGIVYVSPQGDAYHNSATCGGLTRHVHLVRESETAGLHICSRCAANAK